MPWSEIITHPAGSEAPPAVEALFVTLLGSKSPNVISSPVAILQVLTAHLVAWKSAGRALKLLPLTVLTGNRAPNENAMARN